MPGTRAEFRYSCWDFLFTCVGLPLLLLDIVLDVWAAVSFYQEKAFVYLGALLLFLVGSSLLAQAYSWLWYSYEEFKMKTKVENLLSQGQLRLLHVFQLGVYFRHAGVLEMAVRSLYRKIPDPVHGVSRHNHSERVAVSLSHDLSMLRLIETFSESAPQLTLMLTIFLQRGQLDPVTESVCELRSSGNLNNNCIRSSMSGTEAEVKHCSRDFLFTCVGLSLFLLDIGLDLWAAVSLYHEKAYVYFSLLLLCLSGSSVLVQVYSWLWYSYDEFKMKTKVEKVLSGSKLKLLHVFQLGIFLRFAGVMEKSVQSLSKERADAEDAAKFLRQDLRILRFIETFSESAPQLALMLTIILREGRLDPVTVSKAIGSAIAIASFLTTYHHSVHSFLSEKEKHRTVSLVLYFIWNLLLISSRLAALALFASVLPCFIFAHFICSWLVLFFFAWRSKTDFMDGPGGEWLYRATVGLIWYFNWLKVAKGNMRNRTVLYHGYMLTDISILCGVWCWKMSTDPPAFVIQPSYTLITAVCVVGVYILGLLLKVIYYWFFHPNLDGDELKGASTQQEAVDGLTGQSKEEQHVDGVGVHRFAVTVTPSAHCHKRMRKLALNFYS